MMLSFTVFHDQIKDGRKRQTIRPFKKWYTDQVRRVKMTGAPLHIWWRNPRTRHPQGHKMGEVSLDIAYVKKGWELTTADARRDGFVCLEDLLDTLGNMYGTDRQAVLFASWWVIRWEEPPTDDQCPFPGHVVDVGGV